MFTGIIEEIGKVKKVSPNTLEIEAKTVLDGTKVGDSIAVNGVCLTVTDLLNNSFRADVMPETLRSSNLGELTPGSSVDLERAMAADGRFGGHIVSGHIDGVGKIEKVKQEDNAHWITIQAPEEILKLIVHKGSIAIDGISLTVADVNDQTFSVSIIPHTGEETILLRKGVGDSVNLENDIIGKYTQRLLGLNTKEETAESNITMDFLRSHGF